VKSNNGETSREYAKHIVFANPSFTLSPVIKKALPSLSEAISEILSANVVVVNLTFNGSNLVEPGFGFLIPKSENSGVLGVVFDSCAMPTQDGGKNISRFTAMLHGHKFVSPNGIKKSNEEVLNAVFEVMQQYLKLSRTEVIESKVTFLEKCIPQYVVGHQDLVKRIDTLVKEVETISLIGASYKGVAITDIIANSKLEAFQIVNKLNLTLKY
jgi:oxygen-dependent protoporphyrinogen oxidase